MLLLTSPYSPTLLQAPLLITDTLASTTWISPERKKIFLLGKHYILTILWAQSVKLRAICFQSSIAWGCLRPSFLRTIRHFTRALNSTQIPQFVRSFNPRSIVHKHWLMPG